jgi:hypothetical protein
MALGERASGEDRLRKADEREAAGERYQGADVTERHLWHREPGEAGRHRPADRDAFGCKLEQRHGASAENQRGERTGERWREPSQEGKHDQEDHAGRDRAQLRIADVSENAPERSERAVGLELDPQQLRQLADDDDHRHAVDEPEQDRSREEVGREPEPRQPGEDRHRTREQREHRREHREPRRTLSRQRGRRERGEDRQAGLGADHQSPRACKQRVQDERSRRGVEAVNRRQAGKLPIRERLGTSAVQIVTAASASRRIQRRRYEPSTATICSSVLRSISRFEQRMWRPASPRSDDALITRIGRCAAPESAL